jgi:ABC-2 type transport system permease protein
MTDTSPQLPSDSQAAGPTLMTETRPMYWSVRRELWENRFLYIAPLIVTAFVLFGSFISIATTAHRMRTFPAPDPAKQHALVRPFDMAPAPIMFATLLIGMFYSLDALYGERRDRSILFWKSLPVSDLTTVLSKASIPLVVLPLVTFAITVATQFIMLLLSSAVLLGSGLSVATLWAQVSLFQMSLMLLYHLVTVHALWYAPIYGWLLLVSGWARRAAFLWAVLPLFAIGIVEKIAFNTSHFGAMLGNRMGGGPEAVIVPGTFPMDPMTHLTPGHYLASPGLWIGLAITTAFLAAAVRLRRYREPI